MLLAFLLVVGLSFYTIASLLTGLVSDYLFEQRIRQDSLSVEKLATTLAAFFSLADTDTLQNRLVSAGGEMGGRLLLVDSEGKVQLDSYGTLLGVRLRKMGARILRMMTRGDNRQALQEHLAEMLAEGDLVITTGGASVGPKDLVPAIAAEIAAEQGGSMLFQSLRIKPGSMTLAAALPQTLLLGLSGNPVAAAATFGLLAVPVLKKMSGETRFAPRRQKAVVRNDCGSCRKDGRRIVLGRLEGGDVYFARDAQRRGQPALCDDCNCFVDIPAGSAPLRKGMEVAVILA